MTDQKDNMKYSTLRSVLHNARLLFAGFGRSLKWANLRNGPPAYATFAFRFLRFIFFVTTPAFRFNGEKFVGTNTKLTIVSLI